MQVKKEKINRIIVSIISFCILLLIAIILLWNHRNKDYTTDIKKYTEYLGQQGKYKEHFNHYNDIFPDQIPASADIEDFCYYYYNPWDPCYLGYLVYSCNETDYEAEYNRLTSVKSSMNEYIYGATSFPYELCAVYADDYYGYIYALADKKNKKFIYVELQFCNGFTDIDYKKIIDDKYLPIGFSALKD